jgi:hypothetical protein
MTLSIANAQAIQACDAFVDAVDAGAGAGILRIYSGSVPANVDTALGAQVVLAELTMSDPAFGAAVDANPNATATANAITDDTAANATGTASFFRIFDSNGVARIQGTCGTSGAELILNSVSLQSGALVEVLSLTVTMPEA